MLNPEQIRLFAWNIQKQRSPAIHGELRDFAADADLGLLQEVWLEDDFSNTFCSRWNASFADGFQTNRRTTGVMTMAAAAPRYASQHQAWEPLLRTPKATSLTRFGLAGHHEEVLVANIHAINFSLGTRSYGRQLQTLRPSIESHTGPVILAGDFNTWSRERVQLLKEYSRQLGLTEVHFTEDRRKRVLNRPLDYIFVRGFQVMEARSHKSRHSDHNPLHATLQLAA